MNFELTDIIVTSYSFGPGEELELRAAGVVRIGERGTMTILVASGTGASASCSADSAPGGLVFERMTVELLEPRTGRQTQLLVVPKEGGPSPVPGTFEVVMRVDGHVWTDQMTVRFLGPDPGRSGRPGR